MQNWGPSACRCGMFFVQAAPEPPLCILETEFPAPDVFGVHAELPRECVYEKHFFRTCRIGVILHVDVVCFSC